MTKRERQRPATPAALALVLLLLTAGIALAAARAGVGADPANVGWGGFGNTPDENRHSPLTQIDPRNVDQLGRVFTVDFRKIDATVRRGQQSYPVELGGVLYMTTNNDNVWALDATKGEVKWRWQPDNVAVFNNFGIVANRGVAVCDGKVFLLTLDMTIVALDQQTGKLIARVPIARAVPGASSNYGYSETSAPICADHHVILGAAGSEYGVRGFVMAYDTNLAPAWPNPFWTVPPSLRGWRHLSRVVGGGVVWTPTTVDLSTHTLYFGTGSATPLYYPAFRPGSNPRADSLIAVDLRTGKMRWWQQQMAHNEWSYDTAQPPLVYTAKIGGKKRRIVSVATMEGVWFAYDAATGQPIYQRVKVIDRTEHPSLQPGKLVPVYPSSLGGLNYSPASYDPHTNYVFNAAAETASLLIQAKLTPTQKKRKLLQGDVFLGLENGDFGSVLPGWRDHGSISAIDVGTGRQVWKIRTPEPERGGVTTTESGLGFAGGGDGVLRAFDLKTGKVLKTFQTGNQIAAGPSIYAVDGKEYLAITSGGTPTSSGGGTASQLQVFALGGSQTQSPPPKLPLRLDPADRSLVVTVGAAAPGSPARARRPAPATTALGAARISTGSALAIRPWDANSSNEQDAAGRVTLGSTPVKGVRLRVDGYTLPAATAADGSFHYAVDITMARRHRVAVADSGRASVRGRTLSDAERQALRGVTAGFSVGYAIDRVTVRVQKNGTVLVSGRVHDTAGTPPPRVSLFTYQLSGRITDSAGKPVEGAVVVTRTQDRQFWTFSSASNADGRYTSFFPASDEEGSDPVPITVQVASGATLYVSPAVVTVPFPALRSSVMNIQLPASGPLVVPKPTAVATAVYEGLVVGVTGPGGVIKPLSERWPDARGSLSMVLPASVRGKTLRFWENQRRFSSGFGARPGGLVDLRSWPQSLPPAVAAGLARLVVPKR